MYLHQAFSLDFEPVVFVVKMERYENYFKTLESKVHSISATLIISNLISAIVIVAVFACVIVVILNLAKMKKEMIADFEKTEQQLTSMTAKLPTSGGSTNPPAVKPK